jgi:hypothetical protein
MTALDVLFVAVIVAQALVVGALLVGVAHGLYRRRQNGR